jgi:Ca2+-binding RTX toxin-like protein
MAILNGGTGNDVIVGTDLNDDITGMSGDDNLSGGAGSDILFGDDYLDGTPDGVDTLWGGDGHDFLAGGYGNDFLYGGAGDDYMHNGRSTARRSGSGTTAVINITWPIAFGGGDTMDGGDGMDTALLSFEGETGHLIVSIADTAAVNVITKSGVAYGSLTNVERMKIASGAGNDILTGGALADELLGGRGNDQLRGGAGDDVLSGWQGDDLMDGGTGVDTVRMVSVDSSRVGFTEGAAKVDLRITGAQNTGVFGSDTFISIENLVGTRYDDVFIGDTVANALYGEGGNDSLDGGLGDDRLDGGTGNDLLVGGAGADHLIGGIGVDTADYESATAAVRVDLSNVAAQDTLAAGIDTLFGVENLRGRRSTTF